MKITCLDKQVAQLLKESFYRIPRFQRPYSYEVLVPILGRALGTDWSEIDGQARL